MPISTEKEKDLISLLSPIPIALHQFYQELPAHNKEDEYPDLIEVDENLP